MSMRVHLGGPDQSPRALRDLLERRIEEVPAGGAIDWMTYYFRDEALAGSLLKAHRRGVAVHVVLEGKPRHRHANDRVIDILGELGDGLRVSHRWFGASHLHTKLYCFSGQQQVALAGSFNPSGNEPEDPKVIADIGDQDRGHNLLVEIDDPKIVTQLAAHVRGTFAPKHIRDSLGSTEAYFFPRRRNPLERKLLRLNAGARLRIVASHVRDPAVAHIFKTLVTRRVEVDLLTHHTLRRSPEALMNRLRQAGVRIYRYQHPDHLPMHAKFMLVDDGNERWSAFGSYNLTRTSRWLNQELLMFSDDVELWSALDRRWKEIVSEPWCRS